MNVVQKLLIVFLVGFFIMTSCQEKQTDTPASFNKLSNAVFYEIFVQSFADSNGDGIGDIQGMTSKLDYLVALGIDAIWLMPMSPSNSYHKYDVIDYRGIHPDYGTLDDFKVFLKEAHKRNIRVVMDLVINHSSSQHPWFLDAKTGKDAKYRDYYVWADKDSIADQLSKKEASFDSGNMRQWHAVEGDDTNELYYGYFVGDMPDLNYDNPAVRKEFYDIGKFWLTEVGVDGFRLDAAKHIFPDDRAIDSHAFWKEFKAEMQLIKPDVYLIGEVWSDTKNASPYAAGFTALFNFDRAFSILESVNKQRVITASISGHGYVMDTVGNMADGINTAIPLFKAYNPEFLEASFLSNHDQNRVASVVGGTTENIKLAAAILLTLPGTPYIYYGEEIGMLGMKPDENIREPMLWDQDDKDTLRTKWMTPKYTSSQTVAPVNQQMADNQSIFALYKRLIELKKSDIFSLGDIQNLDLSNTRLMAYYRNYNDQSVIIIHNLSDEAQVVESTEFNLYDSLIWQNGKIEKGQGSFTIDARSSMILGKI